ncbi:hypothetical protein DBR43_02805 [Pedobacter sp. KBW06]|uniref:hypothetical protein n=1 Tax=Pedobacter sp. KBW06 TaxID=2153359 RepID=UPI000F5A1AED|nr:hypothetical protein [Pedobacter sp. KBW06]RQO74343.1 hypothetical protein DBR43_02805 [Pedobacter sp. KBW06]
MKNLFVLLAIFPFMVSCNGQNDPNYKYSDQETEQFLNEITKNAKVSITDITEIKKQPTDEFGIITRCPLSKKEVDEYHKNHGTIVVKDDNIYDFASYILKDFELTNENNEKLQFIDNGRSKNLQGLPLGEYEKILYQNLGVVFKLNKKFEKLNGFIKIGFKMPNGMEKEIKIPVNITINDKIPE